MYINTIAGSEPYEGSIYNLRLSKKGKTKQKQNVKLFSHVKMSTVNLNILKQPRKNVRPRSGPLKKTAAA